jgi:hypothetical protein
LSGFFLPFETGDNPNTPHSTWTIGLHGSITSLSLKKCSIQTTFCIAYQLQASSG